MPRNPFAHPLFWPVAWRVAAVLLVGLVAVLIVERRRTRPARDSPLLARVGTWTWIAPLFVLTMFTGGFVVLLFAAAVAVQGQVEYARLVQLERRYLLAVAMWTVAGMLIAALARRYFLFVPVGFFLIVSIIPIVSGRVEGAHRQLGAALFGWLYVGLPMALLVFVKAVESWGLEFLLVVGLAVALSDVAAFTVGSALRGPRLAPAVSPGKTWNGTIGNLLGAAAGTVILTVVWPDAWRWPGVVALIVAVAVGAVWGDLIESTVKRDFAVKDAGTALAGFGGVLDRVDSLLIALPLAYYALLLGNRVT